MAHPASLQTVAALPQPQVPPQAQDSTNFIIKSHFFNQYCTLGIGTFFGGGGFGFGFGFGFGSFGFGFGFDLGFGGGA